MPSAEYEIDEKDAITRFNTIVCGDKIFVEVYDSHNPLHIPNKRIVEAYYVGVRDCNVYYTKKPITLEEFGKEFFMGDVEKEFYKSVYLSTAQKIYEEIKFCDKGIKDAEEEIRNYQSNIDHFQVRKEKLEKELAKSE